MSLVSDITINVAKFNPAVISEEIIKSNDKIIANSANVPKWFEVGASKYREMRWNGETAFPAPQVLDEGMDFRIPSRDPERNIPCRVVYPSDRTTPEQRKNCKGTLMHFHGGGWVLGDERSTDVLLQYYANAGDLAAITVGYRLAPEDPFPKGPQDCIDAGEYLIKNSVAEYGGPLKFVGGESAGAHLSLLTIFHLLQKQPSFELSGLLLHFGCYDMTELPQVMHFDKPLILDRSIMKHFISAFLPGKTPEDMKDPLISPYYKDLEKFRGRLPKALYTIGTEDPLLDDSIAMGTKWLMAGGDAIIKVYPGAPHGFISFPPTVLQISGQAREDSKIFIQDCMAS